VSRGKFARRPYHKYVESVEHERAQVVRSSFYSSDNLRLLTDVDSVVLTGVIRCEGGIRIQVDERVRFVRRSRFWLPKRHSEVELLSYSYTAARSRGGSVFRYDSPDPVETEDTPDHHRYHHVHRFDDSGKQVGEPEVVRERDVPSFRQVFNEAERWYYDNREKLSNTKGKRS